MRLTRWPVLCETFGPRIRVLIAALQIGVNRQRIFEWRPFLDAACEENRAMENDMRLMQAGYKLIGSLVLAILVLMVGSVNSAMAQTNATIGDRVWFDADDDGLQE